MSGNTSKTGDGGEGPEESYLFLLTVSCDPGIGLTGDRVAALGKAVTFVTASVRFRRPLKIRWRDLFAPLVVLITASGLQG